MGRLIVDQTVNGEQQQRGEAQREVFSQVATNERCDIAKIGAIEKKDRRQQACICS